MTALAEQLYDELLEAFNTNEDLRNDLRKYHDYLFEEEGPVFSTVPSPFFDYPDEFSSRIELKSGILEIGNQEGRWEHGHMAFQEFHFLGKLFVTAAEYNSWDCTEWGNEFIQVERAEKSRIGTLYVEVKD